MRIVFHLNGPYSAIYIYICIHYLCSVGCVHLDSWVPTKDLPVVCASGRGSRFIVQNFSKEEYKSRTLQVNYRSVNMSNISNIHRT